MSDIPTDLFRLILITLPVQPLFRFRCVCKTWHTIIDNTVFGNLHTKLHHHSEERAQFIIDGSGKLFFFSTDSFSFSGNIIKSFDAKKINKFFHGLPGTFSLPLPSLDGLILIYQYEKNWTWSLWNPFTGDFLKLPEHPTPTEPGGESTMGLGYDLTTNDYKVVNVVGCYLVGCSRIWLEIFVYSLKLGKWRKIDDFNNFQICGWRHGVYLNGALYWINIILSQDVNRLKSLTTLDLGTKKCNVVPLPSSLSTSTFTDLVLDVLDKSLFMSYCYIKHFYYMVDELKFCGVHSEWTKVYSSTSYVWMAKVIYHCPMGYMRNHRVIAYSMNKNQLFISYNVNLILCVDVQKGVEPSFTISGIDDWDFTYQVFHPSLLRLGNVSGIAEGITAAKTEMRNRGRKSTIVETLELELKSEDLRKQ